LPSKATRELLVSRFAIFFLLPPLLLLLFNKAMRLAFIYDFR